MAVCTRAIYIWKQQRREPPDFQLAFEDLGFKVFYKGKNIHRGRKSGKRGFHYYIRTYALNLVTAENVYLLLMKDIPLVILYFLKQLKEYIIRTLIL